MLFVVGQRLRAAGLPRTAALLEMSVIDYMQHIRLNQNSTLRVTKALVIAIPTTATYMDALNKLDMLKVHRFVECEGRECTCV